MRVDTIAPWLTAVRAVTSVKRDTVLFIGLSDLSHYNMSVDVSIFLFILGSTCKFSLVRDLSKYNCTKLTGCTK